MKHRMKQWAVWALLAWAVGMAPGCLQGELSEEWSTAQRGDLVLSVEVTGVLEAVESEPLGPPPVPEMWNFKIADMAPEGSEIKEGEVAVAFDMSELRNKLEQKQNERDAAAKELETKVATARMARQDDQLQISQAEAELRKTELKADVPPDLTAAIELRKAKLDLALAQSNLAHLSRRAALSRQRDEAEIAALRDQRDRADARVKEIEAFMGRMRVAAPRAGTVIYPSNEEGQKKKVGDSVWRMEKAVEIVSLDKMKAAGEVDEMDASKVALDQRVTLRLDAHPDVEYTGAVRAINDAVESKSRENPVKVVRMQIALDQSEPKRMRPGMRFRGQVETERLTGVMVIPVRAVFATDQGPVAYRKRNGEVDVAKLTLGPRNQELVEVKSGLTEGDQVSLTDLGDSVQGGP